MMNENKAYSKESDINYFTFFFTVCVTCAERHARRSGVRPKALSSRTLCCVGLVFYIMGK